MKIGDVVFVNNIGQNVTIREVKITGAIVNWFDGSNELFTRFVNFSAMQEISEKRANLNKNILNLIHKFVHETGLSIELRDYKPAVGGDKKGLYLETGIVNL